MIPAGHSVRLLLPGAVEKNYTVTGAFYSTYDANDPSSGLYNDPVNYTLDGTAMTPVSNDPSTHTFSLSGSGTTAADASVTKPYQLSDTSGGSTELIFGGDREICRMVLSERVRDDGTPIR